MNTRLGSPWRLVVAAALPWLLGARGCIEELSVGVDRYAELPDASNPAEGGVLDGGLSTCDETSCSDLKPAPLSCENGESYPAQCVQVAEACQWQVPSCPPSDDGGTEPVPCRADECEFILSFDLAGVSDEFASCGDGSPPVCQRNTSGYCSYECPPEVSCSLERNTCATDSFCVFRLGTCGHNGESALCQPKSDTCPQLYEPVCGCDGYTYENTCRAFRKGVSVAFNGACDTKPALCDTCESQTFAFASELCADGQSRRGPTCVTKPKGGCAYQWLECPEEACVEAQHATPKSGECWTAKDCGPGQQCLEVSVCGCHQTCISADRPGHCA